MPQMLFENESQITNDWLFYIENQAIELSAKDKFTIENYIDSEVFNPDIQNYLINEISVPDLISDDDDDDTNLILNSTEQERLEKVPKIVKPRFLKLKKFLIRNLCKLRNDEDIDNMDAKEIIKKLVIIILPIFAGGGGVPALLLPIIIALIASMLKDGVENLCNKENL